MFHVSLLYASAMSRLSVSVSLLFTMASLSSFAIVAGLTYSGDVDMMLLVQKQLRNTPSTWKDGDPCASKWDGVSCNGSRIISLTLSSVNLKGQLPIEIGQLSALEILDLSYNPGLTGQIPSSLGDLQQLQTLILIGCRFSGLIPEELGKLHRLVTLDMNSNDLSGSIPPSLGNLTKLFWFDLSNNSISGEFPVELKGLVHCGHFHFNKNKLSGSIPPEVFHENMTLKHVLFDDNLLTGEIPSTIGNVSSINVLRLDRNSFIGPIPSNIAHLENVNELHLSNNRLNGSIPDLSGMKNLKYMDLSKNSFEVSDLPTWLSALKELTTIVLEHSNLNGQLPSQIFSLPQLETVRLSNNSIDGPLSITEGTVSQQLQSIDLRYNNITDIPLGKSYTKTWMIEGNPVCDSTSLSKTSMCRPESYSYQETSYQTDTAHCGKDTTCTGDSEKLDPQSCQCAKPYTGTIVLRSPSFSTLTNTHRFKILENSLQTGLNLTKGSVYLCCMSFDANGYLNIPVWLFPPNRMKTFGLSDIINIGFALSNQTYKPPNGFGPYYFIPRHYIPFVERSKSLSTRAIVGIASGAAVLISAIIAVGIYAFWQRRKAAKAVELSNPFASWGAASRRDSGDAPKLKGARVFSFQELKMATNKFSRHNEIGSGGYGKGEASKPSTLKPRSLGVVKCLTKASHPFWNPWKKAIFSDVMSLQILVYKGILPVHGQMVAVKRAKKESNQGGGEFKTELELLSRVHHKNLVGLIGFCFEEGSEQMLVYEHMPNGSLRDNLSGKTGIRLDWRKRCCIALGSARGLAYLHDHADPPIIHRDVKSTNILLDENMTAKVADFGLCKHFGDTGNKGHVSTQVKGTMGYLDPEYYMSQQLTQKSDVYSFGVVLMEILASRQPLVERGKYLVQEVKTAMDTDGINAVRRRVLDPILRDFQISETALESFVSLSLRCVEDSAVNRPKMSDVVKELELIVESLGGPYDATTEAERESPTPLRGAHHPSSSECDCSETF